MHTEYETLAGAHCQSNKENFNVVALTALTDPASLNLRDLSVFDIPLFGCSQHVHVFQ